MYKNNNIDILLKELESDNYKIGINVNIKSELDHKLVYMSPQNRIKIFKKDIISNRNISVAWKAYIAGLAEYIFNKNNMKVPDWVNRSEYFLDELTYCEGTLAISEGNDEYRKSFINMALPEFIKRNLVITDVLSAI